MTNRIGDALSFQSRALGLRAYRQQLLAGNIANADTPNYKARDFDFSAALQEAVAEVYQTTADDVVITNDRVRFGGTEIGFADAVAAA